MNDKAPEFWIEKRNEKSGTRDKLADLIGGFFGVDPAYFGVDGYAMADHLIANGVVISNMENTAIDFDYTAEDV